ncbi:MAG: DUF1801 domain-containing protein [Pyrinomonadaceae bacterium]|nr:DUF1801 domain-containing protein [Pyrinomonadaceae bacterium]
MAKVELKTRQTDASVDDFIAAVADERQRDETRKVLEMFKQATGEEPKMWGPAIIGFGSQMLKYASGRELDWPIAAFSPRKGNLTLYVICSSPRQPKLLGKLGKHSIGKSCLYIKRLSDVDEKVLFDVIKDSVEHSREHGYC